MSKNKLDDLLRKKIEEADFAYKEGQWESFLNGLPPVKRSIISYRFKTILLGTAAAIALLLASVLLIRYMNQDVQNDSRIYRNQFTTTMASNSNNASAAKIVDSIISEKGIASHSNTVTKQLGEYIQPNKSNKSKNSNTKVKDVKFQNLKQQNTNLANNNSGQFKERNKAILPKSSIAQNKLLNQNNSENITIVGNQSSKIERPNTLQNRIEKETILSVGGGMNYGSINSGYSIGVSAKRDLGNNFFVAGTVAMMYHNDIQNSGNYSTSSTNQQNSFNSQIQTASTTYIPNQSLYYLQFNPTFGYQIGEKIAVSVGGDLQKLITNQSQSENIQILADGVRKYPKLDFGITGKASFNIAPHIQAGMLFREGLNNFISNNPTNYVNRRYFEVQFQYSIPIQ